MTYPINNVNRTVGARMGGWIAERFGNYQLMPGQIKYTYTGIAGQSFGSFITQGMELKLIGEGNDYVAKGLSGGRVIIVPPKDAAYDVENSPIVGNVVCFGANRGEGYFRGKAGERFCVRNSGANVVVEGVGDHGCEYMTGGVAVILGPTGRNFAAGMSGGVAYVYDPTGTFADKCNLEMVDLFKLGEAGDDAVLNDWENAQKHFVKVYPREYHEMVRVTEELAKTGLKGDELIEKAFIEVIGEQTVPAGKERG